MKQLEYDVYQRKYPNPVMSEFRIWTTFRHLSMDPSPMKSGGNWPQKHGKVPHSQGKVLGIHCVFMGIGWVLGCGNVTVLWNSLGNQCDFMGDSGIIPRIWRKVTFILIKLGKTEEEIDPHLRTLTVQEYVWENQRKNSKFRRKTAVLVEKYQTWSPLGNQSYSLKVKESPNWRSPRLFAKTGYSLGKPKLENPRV